MAKDKASEKETSTKKSPGGSGAAKKPAAAAAQVAVREALSGPPPAARLREHYRERVVPDLMQKFGYRSVMQVPRIRKITLNMGVGESVGDKKILDNAVGDMARIAGQKPVTTKARRSIANFKVRAGFPIGCMVTLRGARMYEFLDRLVNIAIPRIRDFRGVSNRAFDGRGNYSLGVREQIIFPEIEYDKVDALRGLNIAISTSARTDEEARALLAAFRFPFKH
jgi:large subunit ribosomal protein L5